MATVYMRLRIEMIDAVLVARRVITGVCSKRLAEAVSSRG